MVDLILNTRVEKALSQSSNAEKKIFENELSDLKKSYQACFGWVDPDFAFVSEAVPSQVDMLATIDPGLRDTAGNWLRSQGWSASANAIFSLGTFAVSSSKKPVGKYDELIAKLGKLQDKQKQIAHRLSSSRSSMQESLSEIDVFVTEDNHFSLLHQAVANKDWDLVSALSKQGKFDLSHAPAAGEFKGDHALFLWIHFNDNSKVAFECLKTMIDTQPSMLRVQNAQGFFPLGMACVQPLHAGNLELVKWLIKSSLTHNISLEDCGFHGRYSAFPMPLFDLMMDVADRHPQFVYEDLVKANPGLFADEDLAEANPGLFAELAESDASLTEEVVLPPLAIVAIYNNVPGMIALINAGECPKSVRNLWMQWDTAALATNIYLSAESRAVLYLAEALVALVKDEGQMSEKTAELFSDAVQCQEDVVKDLISMAIDCSDQDQAFIFELQDGTGGKVSLSSNRHYLANMLLEGLKALDIDTIEADRNIDLKALIDEISAEVDEIPSDFSSEVQLELHKESYPSLKNLLVLLEEKLSIMERIRDEIADASDPEHLFLQDGDLDDSFLGPDSR